MQFITQLPDNKLGQDDILFINSLNDLAANGQKISTMTNDSLSVFDAANHSLGLYSNNLEYSISSNTGIIPPSPQPSQYITTSNRCYKYKIKLNVLAPNLTFTFYNMENMGNPVDLSVVGTYYLLVLYYIDGTCFYRIVK